jgi:hypothetical protein
MGGGEISSVLELHKIHTQYTNNDQANFLYNASLCFYLFVVVTFAQLNDQPFAMPLSLPQ